MATINPTQHKTKNGQITIIRSAMVDDAQQILKLATDVIGEEIFQLTSSLEFKMTIDDEINWIKGHLDKPSHIVLVAIIDGKIIGMLDFSSGRRNRISHTGEFGMSVDKSFRNQGVGSLLIQTLIDWAKELKTIEKINLQVHSTNIAAIETYKKSGFTVEGIRKKELKYSESEYVDSVLMAKFVN